MAEAAPETPAPKPPRKSRLGRYLLLAVVVFGAIAASGIVDRNRSDAELATWTDQQAIPTVDLVSPKQATRGDQLSLPADIQAFYTAPLHSQVSGYVQMWYHDIGARVTKGELLAKIDAPELDQQYERAKSEVAKAQADYNLAVLTADRWKALRASQAVSQQTADEKQGDALARKAEVDAAHANVDRIKAMMGFENIVAPFDGVITARRIEVGALVSSTNTSAAGLFDISQIDRMRVYVQVPQVDADSMKVGLPVSLLLPQYPGRTFTGHIDTTSDSISDKSRSLLVEALFPNPKGELTPGAFASAHFDLPLDPHKLVIPSSSLIFRDRGAEVAVVKGGRVMLKPITILLDTGPEIELAEGLDRTDKIVASPSDAIETGDAVRVERIDGKAVDKANTADAGTGDASVPAREAAE